MKKVFLVLVLVFPLVMHALDQHFYIAFATRVLIYALIGVISTYVAIRAFIAARRLARRFDEAQPLEVPDDAPVERSPSVWTEILGRRRG